MEQLRKVGARRFEYPVQGKPDFTTWDIDMILLRYKVNNLISRLTVEVDDAKSDLDKIVDAQLRFFTALYTVLKTEAAKGEQRLRVSRGDLIKSLALWSLWWMEEHGKSGKTTATVNHPMLCSVIPDEWDINPNIISKRVSEIRRDMKNNPEQWVMSGELSDEEVERIRKVLGDDAADDIIGAG